MPASWKAFNDALREARSADDVLSWLARGEWCKRNGLNNLCPSDRITSVETLTEWLPNCPRQAWRDAWERAENLLEDQAPLYLLLPAREAARGGKDIYRPVTGETPDGQPSRDSWLKHLPLMHSVICSEIENLHYRWAQNPSGKHPLGSLIHAWQHQPVNVEPDKRDKAIMPSQAQSVRRVTVEPRDGSVDTTTLFDTSDYYPTDGNLGAMDGQAWLPGFEPPSSDLVPSLPLVLYDIAGGTSLARGRGAPLALRVFVEVALAVPLNQRSWRSRMPVPIRDLIRWCWPGGWHSLKRDGPKLARALRQVDTARIPWDGGYWRPLSITNLPHNIDDTVVFDIEMPPGSGRGPMVYRPVLRQLGVNSAPAYRAYLGLCELRNRYLTHGGKLIAPTVPEVRRHQSGALIDSCGEVLTGKGGIPIKHWSDQRAIRTGRRIRNPALDRLPWLSDNDLATLCYPAMPKASRNPRMYTQRAKAVLKKMKQADCLRIEREHPCARSEKARGRWRIVLTELPEPGSQ